MNTIDVCLSPLLYPAYHDSESIVVVVDILRASTTIVTAFMNGARRVFPVATTDEAMVYKKKGWLVGAERNAMRCGFADFGNSPFEYSRDIVDGKDIALTTTNGTRAIALAKDANEVLIGAFLNLPALATYCETRKRNVVILCAAWEDKVNIEDTIFAGALSAMLQEKGLSPASDAVIIVSDLWNAHKEDLPIFVKKASHYNRLVTHNQADSFSYCLEKERTRLIPRLMAEDNRSVLHV